MHKDPCSHAAYILVNIKMRGILVSKFLVEVSCEAIWSWALFAGRFLITVSMSVLVMGLLRFSISSWSS